MRKMIIAAALLGLLLVIGGITPSAGNAASKIMPTPTASRANGSVPTPPVNVYLPFVANQRPFPQPPMPAPILRSPAARVP